MRSTLCEAVARCHARRLRDVAGSAPLPAAIVALVLLIAPVILFRLGGAVGAELSRSTGTTDVSEGIAIGPLLAAAVAGAVLAVAAPARSALGSQVAAGPSRAVVAVLALALVPVAVGSIVVVPALVAACIGLARALPGGAMAGVALAAATVAAVPAGAVVAEGAIAAGRKQLHRTLAVGAGVLGWIASGLALGAAPLGPLALVPVAIRDAGSSWLALAVSSGVAIALASAWVALAATRAEPASRRRAARCLGRRRLPTPIAAGVLLGRRDDLRLATVGATVFGLAGAALATATEAPPPAPFLLGTTTALLGSLLWPLVVGGVLVDGRWLWRSAPVRPGLIPRSFALASAAGSALPVAVVGGVAAAVSGAHGGVLGAVVALVVVGCGVALIAGALIPWRGTGAGDQMTTIAAFAAIAIAASLVVGIVAPRLVTRGVPDAVAVVGICVVSLAAALAALHRRLGAVG